MALKALVDELESKREYYKRILTDSTLPADTLKTVGSWLNELEHVIPKVKALNNVNIVPDKGSVKPKIEMTTMKALQLHCPKCNKLLTSPWRKQLENSLAYHLEYCKGTKQ